MQSLLAAKLNIQASIISSYITDYNLHDSPHFIHHLYHTTNYKARQLYPHFSSMRASSWTECKNVTSMV